jgi:hypothetical protein
MRCFKWDTATVLHSFFLTAPVETLQVSSHASQFTSDGLRTVLDVDWYPVTARSLSYTSKSRVCLLWIFTDVVKPTSKRSWNSSHFYLQYISISSLHLPTDKRCSCFQDPDSLGI